MNQEKYVYLDLRHPTHFFWMCKINLCKNVKKKTEDGVHTSISKLEDCAMKYSHIKMTFIFESIEFWFETVKDAYARDTHDSSNWKIFQNFLPNKPRMMAMRFHLFHGSAITLSTGQTCAMRSADTYHHGLVFSEQPLCINQRLGLQLGVTTSWAGAVRVGITSLDPVTLTTSEDGLPSEAHPTLMKREGFWMRVIPERLVASPRCRLVLNLTSLGR